MQRSISSRNHKVIKNTRRLKKKAYRDRSGLFLVEGVNLVREAVNSGARIEVLLHTGSNIDDVNVLRTLSEHPFSSYEIDSGILDLVSDVVTSQGIVAAVEQIDSEYEEFLSGDISLLLVADQVRDPGNLGALIRVADAAGADGFLLTAGCVDLFNPKVVRSAAGSHFHIPLIRGVDFGRLRDDLRRKRIQMLGMDPYGDRDYLDVDYGAPVALIVGNEAAGITDRSREALDETVFIDMPGRAESLNVASAAAVVLFEALRQRRNSGS